MLIWVTGVISATILASSALFENKVDKFWAILGGMVLAFATIGEMIKFLR